MPHSSTCTSFCSPLRNIPRHRVDRRIDSANRAYKSIVQFLPHIWPHSYTDTCQHIPRRTIHHHRTFRISHRRSQGNRNKFHSPENIARCYDNYIGSGNSCHRLITDTVCCTSHCSSQPCTRTCPSKHGTCD